MTYQPSEQAVGDWWSISVLFSLVIRKMFLRQKLVIPNLWQNLETKMDVWPYMQYPRKKKELFCV